MSRRIAILRLLIAAPLLLAGGSAPAQQSEPLTRWQYYQEAAAIAPTGLADIALDAQTLSGSREDHSDLRLYTTDGREIPYDLRIRDEVQTTDQYEAEEFNRGAVYGSTQISYDLGDDAAVHNEVEINTAGNNFRRSVMVEGSRDGNVWATLARGSLIFRFSSSSGSVDQQAVKYPESRYRYLRVTVERDLQVESDPPNVEGVTVRKTIKVEGEKFTFTSLYPSREATRRDGREASAYTIELESRLPVSVLKMSLTEESFSRPYVLEAIDGNAGRPQYLLSGTLSRREGEDDELALEFPETWVTALKLTVTDDRNVPLSIIGVFTESALRQMIFQADQAQGGTVRIYYGNRDAGAPYYDFASTLPIVLPAPPQRLYLGPRTENPDYRPVPLPFTERAPWAVYLVLIAASLALLWILMSLTKAMEAEPTAEEPAS